MSGEVDHINPHVMKIELDLFTGGFEPYIEGEQDGFWVEDCGGTRAAVHWLPFDYFSRLVSGYCDYSFEDRAYANQMHRAYAMHLSEVAEDDARRAFQRPPEYYQ